MNDNLAARLERLERVEIAKAAVTRYGRAIDARDVGAIADGVFTADAVLRAPNGEYHGIDAILGFFREAFAGALGMQRHFMTNQVANPVGENEVEIESYFYYFSVDQQTVIGSGAYRDRIVVRNGVGMTREKTILIDVFKPLQELPSTGG